MKKEKGMKFKVYDRVDPATLKSNFKELGTIRMRPSTHQSIHVRSQKHMFNFSFWGFEKVNLSSHFPILVIPSPQKNENENRKKNAVYELSGSQLRLGIDVMNETIFMIE